MSKFKLSTKSLGKLQGVHPDLVKVIKRAIELTPYDFGVSEGVRTIARQEVLFEEGKSQTMNSKHIPVIFTRWSNGTASRPAGVVNNFYGAAVDLVVYVNGNATWEHKYFRKVIQAVFTAAIEHGVQVEAGALWRDFLDSPHIQLNMGYYDAS